MEINFTKEIQDAEIEIKEGSQPLRIPLTKQTFIVWYLLNEGNTEIHDGYLQAILDRNILLIHRFYPENGELLFLRGWMIKISPWYFNMKTDTIGDSYLRLAYKYHPDNILYKWTQLDHERSTKISVETLEVLVLNNLEKYLISYVPIQVYFGNIFGRR